MPKPAAPPRTSAWPEDAWYPTIDIGINLTDQMFRGKYHGRRQHADDMVAVLSRARRVGVQRMMVTAGCSADIRHAQALLKEFPAEALTYTVGVHPTRAAEFETFKHGPLLEHLRATIERDRTRVVAVGECGLDYDRLHFCDRATQQRWFEPQLELAAAVRLPLFLHNRAASDDFFAALQRHPDAVACGGVVHSFTDTLAEARRALDMGLYIGINGCSLKTPENLEMVRGVPLDRIMLETDGPWCEIRPTHASFKLVRSAFPACKPERYQEGMLVRSRQEPCQIIQVLEVVAALHDVSPQVVAEQAYRNTMRCFFPDEDPTPATRGDDSGAP